MLDGAANLYHAAHTRRVSAAGLALLQAKLPRNSSQIARGRIRQFESSQPSQPVVRSAQKTARSFAVLIVEDDADLRRLTAAMLEDEQLDIIECESAEAALAVMLITRAPAAVALGRKGVTGAIHQRLQC
jgi:PleD family two-component response regulator